MGLSACYSSVFPLDAPTANITVISATSTTPARITTDTPMLADRIYDARQVMRGICFESAWDAAGQAFVIRSAEEHIRFYDLADNSRLCARPVTRYPFDFTDGAVLAGLWNRGIGCTADHELLQVYRDDADRTLELEIHFTINGTCPYEIVRGFWVSMSAAQDYTITITVRD